MKKDTNLLDTQDVRAEAATALTPNATNGEKIKALRTAQGMSMAELSRRASMSDRAIRYIEAGEREPLSKCEPTLSSVSLQARDCFDFIPQRRGEFRGG